MKNTKHTPGPWEAVEARTMIHIGPVGQGGYIASSSKRNSMNREEWRANARLIAAAPELLEALRTLVQLSGNIGQIEHCLNTNARAAIAKATGQQ